MRQVGILAAACLHALDHHVERLAEDHARTQRLAAAWRSVPGIRVVDPDTNILFVHLEHAALDARDMLAELESRGVRMSRYGPRLLRAIVHLDVDDAGIDRAIEAFSAAVGARLGQAAAR